MRYFFDTNVILDVLLDRIPFAAASSALWALIEKRLGEGVVAAHAVTTIFYMVRKLRSSPAAWQAILRLLGVFSIATVDAAVIETALYSGWTDFEDAINAGAAQRAGCDLIITRNLKHFQKSRISVHTPESAMAFLSRNNNG